MSFSLPSVTPDGVPAAAPLLDVREPDEWAAGHVEGALHIPIGQVVERIGEISEHAGGQPLYVLCKVGGRSAQVTAYLTQQGMNAVNVDGGVLAWQSSGRPLTSDNGEPFVL
ncbi:rhodanese-like domain-containing protein [Streptomyces sp. PT12]|uniref:rhodanese-like domain-containing protein n=1 Tax=Streptomyces sp. PT12 TaxID=1510197 RepID=UPI000DE2B139|nr:rhodanese-like domain-containing protein [Streptomyces sp. PT12]RBM05528.1 sulfurtransferase [Streptomyces sp. PT12]